jgi:hypothetical protein
MLRSMTQHRCKKGEVREDGMVFYRYQRSSRNGEYWMKRDDFEKRCRRDRRLQGDAQDRRRGSATERLKRRNYMRQYREGLRSGK